MLSTTLRPYLCHCHPSCCSAMNVKANKQKTIKMRLMMQRCHCLLCTVEQNSPKGVGVGGGTVCGSKFITQLRGCNFDTVERRTKISFLNKLSTMALGLTQPLTELSTRDISWGLKRQVCRADNLTTFMCRLS
jgi:hypothetical protein